MKKFIINLPFDPPLNWEVLLSFFQLHQVCGVKKITNIIYERSFKIDNTTGFFKISHKEPNLIAEVLTCDATLLPVIEQKLRKMFDLNLDPKLLLKKFLKHPLLKNTYAKFPALRIPGGWDMFETAINTIISQSISIAAARTILAKLILMFGEQVAQPVSKEKMFLFPSPEMLSNADLSSIGITNHKKNAIRELSEKIVNKEIDLESSNVEQLKTDLLAIKGIGQWTVEYIMLRCSPHKNAFPGNDLILKRYAKEVLDIEGFDGIKSYTNHLK